MKIRTKLAIVYGVVVVFVLLVGIVGINATNSASQSFSTLVNDVVATDTSLKTLRFNANLYITAVSELGVLYANDPVNEEIATVELEIQEALQAMRSDVQQFRDLITFYSPDELEGVEILDNAVLELQTAGNQFADAIRSGVTGEELLEIRENFEIYENGFNAQINELIDFEAAEIITIDEELINVLRDSTELGIGLMIFCLIAAVIGGAFITRSISKPISELQRLTTQISRGDYQQSIEVTSKDEIGELSTSFNLMTQAILKRDTDLKETAKQLEQQIIEAKAAREQAELSDKVKSAFLASMSHELRTPLNSVINFSKFVAKGVLGPVNERQSEILGKVIDSGKHLLNLINDVLDMSKIESGSLSLFIEEDVDLNEILHAAVSTAESLLDGRSVDLQVQIDEQLPHIKCDRQRVRQILFNVVSNACKFTQEGHIKLVSHMVNNEIIMEVEDTGPGIAEKDRQAVFQAFKQTETGLRKGGGTGLGMPISKNLAKAHGGRLWFDSQVGKGTTFYIALPLIFEQLIPANALVNEV